MVYRQCGLIIMKIEKVKKEDIKNIATLAFYVWVDTYTPDGMEDEFSNFLWKELSPENFSKRLSVQSREIYKIVMEDHIVGFMEINYESPTEYDMANNCEIEKIYIHKNYQNIGLGSKLMSFTNSLCKEKGIKKYWLSVYEKNENAINFYQKHSFKNIGEMYFEIGSGKHKNYVLSKEVV
jgi:diamine N-acetyltransferase